MPSPTITSRALAAVSVGFAEFAKGRVLWGVAVQALALLFILILADRTNAIEPASNE